MMFLSIQTYNDPSRSGLRRLNVESAIVDLVGGNEMTKSETTVKFRGNESTMAVCRFVFGKHDSEWRTQM